MTGPLTLVLKVNPTNVDAFDAVYAKMNASSQNEEGTITYRMFRADDGTTFFYDDYASSEAFLTHFNNLQSSGNLDALMGACEIKEVFCFGDPNPDAAKVLADLGATVASHVAGFSRLDLAKTTV